MTFLDTIRSWFGPEPAPKYVPTPQAYTAVSSAGQITALLPASPSLEVQRYCDSNHAVSRAEEARKIHAMARICEINNAAAEDVIDRRGTKARPARPSHPSRAIAPLTAQEEQDAINLAEVVFTTENAHDPRQ